MKKGIRKVFIVLLIILVVFRFTKRTHLISHFGNFNEIEVVTNKVVDEKKLVVMLFTEGSTPVIIFDKGKPRSIPEEYGPNKLVVIYNDSLSCSVEQWKLNCNHDHLYKLTFSKKDNDFFCTFDIRGEEEVYETMRLSKK